jgi:hypothetical protein
MRQDPVCLNFYETWHSECEKSGRRNFMIVHTNTHKHTSNYGRIYKPAVTWVCKYRYGL